MNLRTHEDQPWKTRSGPGKGNLVIYALKMQSDSELLNWLSFHNFYGRKLSNLGEKQSEIYVSIGNCVGKLFV